MQMFDPTKIENQCTQDSQHTWAPRAFRHEAEQLSLSYERPLIQNCVLFEMQLTCCCSHNSTLLHLGLGYTGQQVRFGVRNSDRIPTQAQDVFKN